MKKIRIIRNSMIRKLFLVALIALGTFSLAFAQFEEPEIVKVEPSERSSFEQRFEDIKWTGQGLYNPTTIDRIPTIELRSRLQAVFGEPTQTIEDLINNRNFRPGKAIQFEYWFVVNDSIPVKVMDVGGPRDRGLIVAADQRVREHLYAIRESLLRPLRRRSRAPYVDYWYEEETRRWYRTGFDGTHFFTDRVYRSRMRPGRPDVQAGHKPAE